MKGKGNKQCFRESTGDEGDTLSIVHLICSGSLLAEMLFNYRLLMVSLQILAIVNGVKEESSFLEANENAECANTNIVLRSRCALLI